MLKKRELRLLDVITRVNDTPVESLIRPVDEELKRAKSVSFVLNCTIAVACSSLLLNSGMLWNPHLVVLLLLQCSDPSVEKLKATHIIVLMNPNQFGRREFGFDVNSFPGQEVLVFIWLPVHSGLISTCCHYRI